MEIKKVGIIGCGLMGSGIAQVCAQAGIQTVVHEIDKDALEKGMSRIDKGLGRLEKKEKITTEEKSSIQGRITGTTDLLKLKDSDLIIEAAIEDIAIKRSIFKTLDEECKPETIFATNTSSLSVIDIAARTSRTDRFCGLHFFNPVPVMALVEVVRTLTTSDETFNNAFNFAKQIGKEPIACKDNSGFVVNLLLVPFMLDAIRAVENGIASIVDIDKGMQLGCGHPMGPLTLLDFVGLDTTYYIANIMFDEYRETRYAPPPLLKRLVLAGHLGKKSGRGFYDYTGDEPVPAL
ncbi:MAG: 3-hydroxybutyryl-CoA dehydrogenase [Deferribacteres bacterium]|nr:3-hydroxybutyryl-CoA dehydrogenase [candidate division KSB1 bacterium]MCB9501275.1 3-hydroxybutyryl-CoA dehydrogenase [Deferribacteres bacterium]